MINFSIVINHHWILRFYTLAFQRGLAAVGIALMYTKLFYWCRLFPQFALTYRVLYDTIMSIRTFFILLLIVLFAFTNINIILDSGRSEEDSYVIKILGNKWVGELIQQWRLGLGDILTEKFSGESEMLVWVVFIIATIII